MGGFVSPNLLNISSPFERRVRAVEREAQNRALSEGRPILASVSTTIDSLDPLAVFGSSDAHDRAYWEQPNRAFAMAMAGSASTTRFSEPGRFEAAKLAHQRILQDAVVDDSLDSRGRGPIMIGGFAFDARSAAKWEDLGAGFLSVPEVLIARSNDSCWLTYSWLVSPGDNLEVRVPPSSFDDLQGPSTSSSTTVQAPEKD